MINNGAETHIHSTSFLSSWLFVHIYIRYQCDKNTHFSMQLDILASVMTLSMVIHLKWTVRSGEC